MTKLKNSKDLEMFIYFADLVKAVDQDLHNDCWDEVYNKFKNK